MGEGSEGPYALWASVGEALSRWEQLQGDLTHLFLIILDSPTNYALLRAFGSSMQVHPKVEQIEYAAEVALPAELRQRIRELAKQVRGLNDRRNDIAHGVAVQLPGRPGVFLEPWYTTSKRYTENITQESYPHPQYCYTADQVLGYSAEFISTSDKAVKLYDDINRHFLQHPSRDRRASALHSVPSLDQPDRP